MSKRRSSALLAILAVAAGITTMGSSVQAADLPILAPARHVLDGAAPAVACMPLTSIIESYVLPMGLASIRVTTIRPSRITILARCALIRGIGYRLLRYRDLFRVPNLFSYHRELRTTYGIGFDPRNYDTTEPHYYLGPMRAYPRYWVSAAPVP